MFEITRNEKFNSLEVRFDEKPSAGVREALKGLHFRWHNAKGVWYGYVVSEEDLRAAIDGADKGEIVVPKADKAALLAEYRERLAAAGESAYWIDWHLGRVGHIAKLSGGDLVVIGKPHVETSFCFGESGHDFDAAVHMAEVARTDEDWFKRENLREFKNWIAVLSRETNGDLPEDRVWMAKNGATVNVYHGPWYRAPENGTELSETDREILLAMYREAYAAFEKRLNAYLKRYGLSKVHSWTYWRDA